MIGGLVEKLVGEKEVEEVVKKKPVVVERPNVVVEKKWTGVLYWSNKNGGYGWYETAKYPTADEKYIGEIKNGKPHGQGRLTFPNGVKWEGEWKDGKKWNVTWYDQQGNYIGSLVNGF